MGLESIELMQSILDTNWNRANTNQRKPVITDITTLEPGRGKRFDLNRSDGVFLYETAHNEEQPEVFYDFVHTRINITIIIHLKRKGDGQNLDRLLFKTRTDLSDRTKHLHRMTFQVEIVIFSELIA